MDFLNHIIALGDVLLRSLSVLFVIMIIIFVHEAGHYLIGRWCGIKASVFSLGFGPQIVSYTDKRGTQWRLALIPLGGYVKFIGDEEGLHGTSSQSLPIVDGSFGSAHAWKKAATVFAGPLFNVLFTVVILTFFFFIYGRVAIEPVVGSFVKDSPAVQAGLQLGDRFIEMDGQQVESFEDLMNYVTFHGGDPIEFKMERSGQVFTTVITPKVVERDDGFGNRVRSGLMGVGIPVDPDNPARLDPAYVKHIRYSFGRALREASKRATFIVTQTVFFMGRLLGGKEDHCRLSGPSKTVKIAWQVSETGFLSLLNFTAFLSIGVGLINLFPIPPLDGGYLLFHVVEIIIGRPISAKIREIIFRLGLCFVLLFMFFALFNDYFCWFS
ncbi:RIP metalloprotease RseP [Bartonella henselae]|uniref:Zinc metalloprotease n=1 Tax=Bartonella henselae TaxID=38323 RepID=X5M419_BARHN|nr:RIP metalloprotease RseP [Bartonella henselae]MDM9996806.1 RIP metalloprotease RseP [Bartonella henselae]OLL49324.1 RIP metalloprotease RseP [Bartonella henselae]OLL51376.1 RIP metalloprotease RseP [Bartonella henselae]OLL52048.1 RIP metalloprotease RseP [Bartonella henselae]OLL58068.1 RIP metalloprotease RseP [Bartonella henselae]